MVSGDHDSRKGVDNVTEKAVFKISGMHCTSCASLIEHTLKRGKGVETIRVDYSTEEASLEFDPVLLTTQSLREAIAELGYEVVSER